MKIVWIPLMAAVCAPLAMAQEATSSQIGDAENFYRQGMAAEKAGDAVAARTAYMQALKLQPNHANARFRLGEIKIQAPALAAKGREARFGAVMIPEFRVEDASLKECLEALEAIVSRQTKDELTPNFILQDPKGQLAESRISLNLKKVPAAGVLRYLLEQSSAEARFDEHAIVISPKS